MRIDTHQHYWHYRAPEFPWISDEMPALRRDCLPSDVQAQMQAVGIEAVVAVQARCVREETDFLLGLASQNNNIVGVIGWADLSSVELDQDLTIWSQQSAFKGLRHILQDEPDALAWVERPEHQRGLHTVQQHGKVYEVLVFEHQLDAALTLCRQHSNHWLVLDHLAKPNLRHGDRATSEWRQQLQAIATLPHVVCKVSGLVTETAPNQRSAPHWPDDQEPLLWSCFDIALEAFGPHRLMFGSDWPVCQLASSLERVHGVVQAWAESRLTIAEQHALWHDNASRFYGLDDISTQTRP